MRSLILSVKTCDSFVQCEGFGGFYLELTHTSMSLMSAFSESGESGAIANFAMAGLSWSLERGMERVRPV